MTYATYRGHRIIIGCEWRQALLKARKLIHHDPLQGRRVLLLVPLGSRRSGNIAKPGIFPHRVGVLLQWNQSPAQPAIVEVDRDQPLSFNLEYPV
jgi:hypothetical protein